MSSETAPATQPDGGATSSSDCMFGECVLKLSHSTTYEPPLYLFPELLPQVPQGTPPLPVWDAVADAVDINASSWRIADASRLLAAGAAAGKANNAPVPHAPQAMVTLTSMVAENRLLAAGLDASALQHGSFSASQVIQQLATLQARMGLSDEEGAAIMSNHFINLLAWQKLREINGGASVPSRTSAGKAKEDDEEDTTNNNSSTSGSSGKSETRKRTRPADGQRSSDAWRPSPHPWATEAELVTAADGQAAPFVAAGERNVEARVELLHTLAELYQRPWRTLASCGQQTDCVVPPGTVNVTSPYADNSKITGALVDPVTDLGWGVAATATDAHSHSNSTGSGGSSAAGFFGSVRVSLQPQFFSIVVSSRNSSCDVAPCRVPLDRLVTYLGREEGTQRAAAVAAAALVPITAGLSSFTSRPELLSKLHCALVLRPVYEQQQQQQAMVPSSNTLTHPTKAEQPGSDVDEDGEEGQGGPDGRSHTGNVAVVHTKTPDHYTLWAVNYARNGVRVVGKGWVLGEPRELFAGDVVVIGDEVELRVEAHATAAAATSEEVRSGGGVTREAQTASQVKRERLEDE